jgi:DHA1 family inner membrane transport protein
MLTFLPIPALQLRVVNSASGAPNLAATLNQGAFNMGNAAGAWIGGSALSLGVSYANLPLVGATIVVMALAVAVASMLIERNGREPIAEPSTIG